VGLLSFAERVHVIESRPSAVSSLMSLVSDFFSEMKCMLLIIAPIINLSYDDP
jgi:hypothetical protein